MAICPVILHRQEFTQLASESFIALRWGIEALWGNAVR